jgi:MFS family permease
MAEVAGLERRPWCVGAAVIGFAMMAVYVTLILTEGNNSFSEVLPWALLMAAPTIGAFVAAVIPDRGTARRIVIGSAVLFAIIGAVSLLSIGIGFLIAAILASVAAVQLSGASEAQRPV